MHRAAYRFFDAGFVLETDTAGFFERFDRAYGSFRLADSVQPPSGAPVYQVLLGDRPQAIIAGEPVRSDDAVILAEYAYNAILNAATARVRSHMLLHAAALRTPGGEGLILAGHAGMGKTTLTLALLKQGFGFLSDDVAALAGGFLYPFPRRLCQRFDGGRPGEKRLLDVAEVADACPARFLFVLADPAAIVEKACWYLVVDHTSEPLQVSLLALDGVGSVEVARGEPYPALRLKLAPGAMPAVEAEVEALCRGHGVLLFDMVQGREGPPDFAHASRLAPLTASEAARELLPHFKGGERSALFRDEFGGSAARLYLALAGLAAGMACHRLYVGRLDATLTLIGHAVA
jgi:hypothetical protein